MTRTAGRRTNVVAAVERVQGAVVNIHSERSVPGTDLYGLTSSQSRVNKIHRALQSVGYPAESTDEIILTWEKLASNLRYQALLQQARDFYRTDGEFQHDCRSEVLRVLKNRPEPPETISPDALDVAAEYFLCETPLFVDTPTILAQNSSVFAYRECIPLLCKLFLGEYRFRVSDQQGFVVVKSAFETEAKAPMFEGMFI